MKFSPSIKAITVIVVGFALLSSVLAQASTGPLINGSQPKNGTTEVWVEPNDFGTTPGFASDWNLLFDPAHEQDWQQVLTKADVYSFHAVGLSSHTPAELKNAVALFNKYHVKIAVEMGGLVPQTCSNKTTAGTQSAAIELKALEPIYQAGGTVNYIALENPTTSVIANGGSLVNGQPNACQFSLADAIAQLTQFLTAVHTAHPEIQPGLIVSLPNEIYNGTPCVQAFYGPHNQLNESRCFVNTGNGGIDYKTVFDSIMSGVKAAGLNLYFLHADNPYSYMINSPGTTDVTTQRLVPLEKQTESYGIPFGLIHNTDLAHASLTTPIVATGTLQQQEGQYNQLFHDQTLQSIQALKTGGGNEEHVFIESWYAYPYNILPETTPNTFMYTVLDAINASQQPVTPPPVTTPPATTPPVTTPPVTTPPVTTPPVTTPPVTTPPATKPPKVNIFQQWWNKLMSLL